MQTTKENIRLYSLDIMKILATVMVVFYHIGRLDMGSVTDGIYIPTLNKLLMNICAICVPLFYMVNGALSIGKKITPKKYFIKIAKTIFVYCAWKLILSSGHFMSQNNGGHLWFLESLILLTVISPAITYLYNNKTKYLILICALIFLFPFCYNYVLCIGRALEWSLFDNMQRTGFMRLYSILYYVLGKVIIDVKEKLKSKKYKFFSISSIIAGWTFVTLEVIFWSSYEGVIFDGVNASFPTIGALLMASGTFATLVNVEIVSEKIKKALAFFSKNILGAYLMHMMVITFIFSLVEAKTLPVYLTLALSVIIPTVLCLVTSVLKKVPIIRYLFAL